MKNFILFVFAGLLITDEANCQISRVVSEISETVFRKIFSHSVEKTAFVLSEHEINQIIKYYPEKSVDIGSNTKLFYHDKTVYKLYPVEDMRAQKYFYSDDRLLKQNLDLDAYRYILRHNYLEANNYLIDRTTGFPKITENKKVTVYSTSPKNSGAKNKNRTTSVFADNPDENTPSRIRKLQFFLNYFNYNLKLDRSLGKDTRKAVEEVFKIDCEGKTDLEILSEIHDVPKPKKNIMAKSAFQMKISKNGVAQEVKTYTLEELNTKLNEFECAPGEVCVGLAKLSGSLSFECKGADGTGLSITISNEEPLNFNLTDGKGNKLAMKWGESGKVTFTSTKESE
jgi:hypothetical protein